MYMYINYTYSIVDSLFRMFGRLESREAQVKIYVCAYLTHAISNNYARSVLNTHSNILYILYTITDLFMIVHNE